jgi:excisionase family DNA binding protein
MGPNPYSVASLAARWGCHQSVVRRLIRKGVLQSFPVGALIRISAAEVERYECNGSGSRGTEASTSSNITTVTDATAVRSTRELWRQRTLKQATSSAPSNGES